MNLEDIKIGDYVLKHSENNQELYQVEKITPEQIIIKTGLSYREKFRKSNGRIIIKYGDKSNTDYIEAVSLEFIKEHNQRKMDYDKRIL